jgi:putative Mg2+ transporter-C (MgtC) family protein
MSALLDPLLAVGVAGLVGAAVGLEREVNGQLAGMRTNALVAAGSALFTMIGMVGVLGIEPGPGVDPMRVAAQVVSGIGFIGAGVILREGGSVRGVTTAAALWTSAALGMAAGAGQYEIAVAGLVVVLTVLVGLRAVRDRGLSGLLDQRRAIDVTYERGFGTLGPIIAAIEGAATLEDLRIDDGERHRHVRLVVRARRETQLEQQLQQVADRPEVTEITLGER